MSEKRKGGNLFLAIFCSVIESLGAPFTAGTSTRGFPIVKIGKEGRIGRKVYRRSGLRTLIKTMRKGLEKGGMARRLGRFKLEVKYRAWSGGENCDKGPRQILGSA